MQANSHRWHFAQAICGSNHPWDTTKRILLAAVLLVAFFSSGCSRPLPSPQNHSAQTNVVEQAMPAVLITVSISPESRVKAATEDVAMELEQGVWKDFLIKIENAAGITAPLVVESEQVLQFDDDRSRDRWLQFELRPNVALTGMRNESRTLRLRSRDSGIRSAILNFNAGQGTQDLGFRSDVLVTFKVHKK